MPGCVQNLYLLSTNGISEADPAGTPVLRSDEEPTPRAPTHRHHLQPGLSASGCTRCICAQETIRHRLVQRWRLVPFSAYKRTADRRPGHRHDGTKDTTDNDSAAWFQMIDTVSAPCNGYM